MILLTALCAGLIVFFPAIRNGRARVLFRAWVPVWRWRFFDQAGEGPARSGRGAPAGIQPGNLFLSPLGNLRHLESTLRETGES